MAAKIPKKGTPIAKADVKDIEYWLNRKRDELASDPDHSYAASDRRWIDEAEKELERRKSGGNRGPAPQERSEPKERKPLTGDGGIVFNSADPAAITAWFLENRENYHIISPATLVQSLPEGCEVSISLVYVNPVLEDGEKSNGEVYETEGNLLALGAVPLARISAAAGISWDVHKSGQIDDGSSPHRVTWQVVGGYRLFDGTPVIEPATKNVDLREGSAQIDGKSEKWVLGQRKNIVENAETKAKNRFIRRLGLKPGYQLEELEDRAFAVARLMFTGRTNDPELRRAFAMLNAQRMMGGVAALFGQDSTPLARAPIVQQIAPVRPVPQLRAGEFDEDEDDFPSEPRTSIPADPRGHAPTQQVPNHQGTAAPQSTGEGGGTGQQSLGKF